jgi:hypothetical protein
VIRGPCDVLGGFTRLKVKSGNGFGASAPAGPHIAKRQHTKEMIIRFMRHYSHQ